MSIIHRVNAFGAATIPPFLRWFTVSAVVNGLVAVLYDFHPVRRMEVLAGGVEGLVAHLHMLAVGTLLVSCVIGSLAALVSALSGDVGASRNPHSPSTPPAG